MIINNERFYYLINKLSKYYNKLMFFIQIYKNNKEKLIIEYADNTKDIIINYDNYIYIESYKNNIYINAVQYSYEAFDEDYKNRRDKYIFYTKQLIKLLNNCKKINKEELIKEAFKSERIENRINIYGMEYLDFEY